MLFMRPPCPRKEGFSEPDSNKTPTVWLSTKKIDDKVLIYSVRDNGTRNSSKNTG